MDPEQNSDRAREKHRPWSPLQICYDGSNKSDGSLFSIDDNGGAWVPSALLYGGIGTMQSHPLLYHYTTESNFSSIIDSGDLWVSEFASMNDYAEMKTALDCLRLTCSSISHDSRFNQRNWALIEEQLFSNFECYILSLSKSGRSLSMFRAYSGVDGVSIGFPLPLFTEGLDGNWVAGDVLYAREQHCALLRPLAEKLCEIVKIDTNDQAIREACEIIKPEFQQIAPFIKNAGFHEEQEIRFVTAGESVPKYVRERNDATKVRYIKLSWLNCLVQSRSSDMAFYEIIVSPGRNSLDRMHRIAKILSDRQRKLKIIHESNITAIL